MRIALSGYSAVPAYSCENHRPSVIPCSGQGDVLDGRLDICFGVKEPQCRMIGESIPNLPDVRAAKRGTC